ncbi:hypothetical protein BCR32DRAFT_324629 [Anaeromyces robustus]|uniref:Uncharacterized protein n=1 Tax=Anaeromyces robustus TaxID=1754192 RepID=A0A1Y1XNE8_9FUNG|nr:hypothetical protein BCR32DRAFT_324629 [Anaeromyces robustus]|eukprot:ORX87026.1 hypothetical protein BCR32DRAFT_324629 [Anaeromyces robustus]
MSSSSSSSSKSSITISPERLKSLDKPRRRLHGPSPNGSRIRLDAKKSKKDKLRKNSKSQKSVSKPTKTKSQKRTRESSTYLNTTDRPYFILIFFVLTSLFLGINAFYQIRISKTGIFHENLDIFNVSKYVFCTAMPLILISVWVSIVLTKMRFLLNKMLVFFLKNLKFFLKPEVILFLIVSFISYRLLLFIPIIFKYIHSVSDVIPYGGPVVSFALIIAFISMMFFLIGWMILIFSYDVSDSIVKGISNTSSYIFGKTFSKFSKKNIKDSDSED